MSAITPDAWIRLAQEKPSIVKDRVQSIIHVSGFHSAICPYQPSINSTGKKAELIKIKTLYETGDLTEEEYKKAKNKILES